MAIPAFSEYFFPVLKQYESGEILSLTKVRAGVAKYFNLSDSDLKLRTKGDTKYQHNDRVQWSGAYLRKAGLLDGASGNFTITASGKALLKTNIT